MHATHCTKCSVIRINYHAAQLLHIDWPFSFVPRARVCVGWRGGHTCDARQSLHMCASQLCSAHSKMCSSCCTLWWLNLNPFRSWPIIERCAMMKSLVPILFDGRTLGHWLRSPVSVCSARRFQALPASQRCALNVVKLLFYSYDLSFTLEPSLYTRKQQTYPFLIKRPLRQVLSPRAHASRGVVWARAHVQTIWNKHRIALIVYCFI